MAYLNPSRKRKRFSRRPAPVRTGLGDFFALEGDCVIGEQLVHDMQLTYKQGSGIGADERTDQEVAFSHKFGPAVTAIVTEFEKDESSFSRHVPFSPICAAIKELGVKAQDLTRQMRDAMGVAQPAGTPVKSPFGPSGAIDDIKGLIYLAGGVMAAIYILPIILPKRS